MTGAAPTEGAAPVARLAWSGSAGGGDPEADEEHTTMRGLAGVRLAPIGEEAMRQTLATTDGADLTVVPGAWTGCQ